MIRTICSSQPFGAIFAACLEDDDKARLGISQESFIRLRQRFSNEDRLTGINNKVLK
jgi:hypothetical protein